MASHNTKSPADRTARLFKLVASPTRIRILYSIQKLKAPSVQEIAADLKMTHSAVSHQLAILDSGEIVESTKSGRRQLYMISNTDNARAIARAIRV